LGACFKYHIGEPDAQRKAVDGIGPIMSKSGMALEGRGDRVNLPGIGFCEEKNRLLKAFLAAIHELVETQKQQTQAVIDGDADFGRFDVLLHMAHERKDLAKYAWIAHVEAHHCEEI
jgi:hypothetical protein